MVVGGQLAGHESMATFYGRILTRSQGRPDLTRVGEKVSEIFNSKFILLSRIASVVGEELNSRRLTGDGDQR